MKTFVSTTTYNSKPSKPVCGKITNQLKQGSVEVTPYQLAEYICNGHTVCPVFPSKKKAEKSEQWYIGFDFDDMPIDMDERLKELKDIPTIAYHTFSHLYKGNRYRFIYVFSKPIYGMEFYNYQQKLKERNHFDNVDPQSQNINRLLHGTIYPVHYSGILYDHELNPVQFEDGDILTRETSSPPPIPPSSPHTYVPTEKDISILTSVGVSYNVAKYYLIHNWDNYLTHYTTTSTLQEETEYVQLDGECYSVAPDEFYSLPRQWRYCHDVVNERTVTYVKPRKWEDGQRRGQKIYQAIITLRTLNQDASVDDLLYYTVREYCTFYNNFNSDDMTCKYNRRGLAAVFADGMRADISIPRKPLKHPAIHITDNGVNKHREAPIAAAKERHKKILALYDPNKDIETNLNSIRETLKIRLSKRTLNSILSKTQIAPQQITQQEREEVFKCMYDPTKTDVENLSAMQDNIPISKATYYRLKKRLITPSV